MPANAAAGATWQSGDTSVATVDETGTVTAVAVGETVVTVAAGGKQDMCEVTVVQADEMEIGDFFYSDGTTSTRLESSKTPIGIVFWSGDPTAEDAALKRDHPGCTHGLVVSLRQDAAPWQSGYEAYGKAAGEWVSANVTDYASPRTGIGAEDPLNRILGYNNTKALEAFNAAPENSQWRIEAVERAVSYRGSVAAPASTSDWYLPSAKELALLCSGEYENIYSAQDAGVEVRDIVNARLSELSGAALRLLPSVYWSSSEVDPSYGGAYNVYFQDGDVSASFKDFSNGIARYVLAF